MISTLDTTTQEQLGYGRLIMLSVASAILYLSIVMSVFAPFPIALAAIVYGRAKGYGISLIGLVVALMLSRVFLAEPSLGLYYIFNIVFAVMVAEIAQRDIAPMKGILKYGLTFIIITSAIAYSMIKASNISVRERVISEFKALSVQVEKKVKEAQAQGIEENLDVLAQLSQPEKMADKMLKALPNYFFVSVFFTMWVNLFLLLKSARFILREKGPVFSEMTLIEFKVPEKFLFLLIPALAIATWGNDLTGMKIESFGITLLWCLGVFYFFQGFGVYSKLLTKMRIFGFIRTMLVIFTVFSAYWLLSLVGVLDQFVNFDRFFVNDSKE